MQHMLFYQDDNPLVSVILPTYNRRHLLNRALKSLNSQTLQHFELIIVDDGSTDNSCQMIFSFLNTFKQPYRYIKQQNQGLPIALNIGLQVSTGKYITFLNSDDTYKPKHLETRFQHMNTHPEIDLIYGGVQVIGNPYVKDKNDLNNYISIDQCTLGATFFGKRNVFKTLNGFKNIPYSEDSDFKERAESKFNIIKLENPKTYVYYRDTPGSITNTI